MTLGELIQQVLEKINRPDLEDELAFRTTQSLRMLHMTADFELDLVDFAIPHASITYQDNNQNVGQFSLPMDVRQVYLLQGFGQDGSPIFQAKGKFEKVTLSELAKRRIVKDDAETYYISGKKISFKSASSVQTLALAGIAYFPGVDILSNPNGTTRPYTEDVVQAYTDWLLDSYPLGAFDFAVSYSASAIGDNDLASHHNNSFQSIHLPLLMKQAKLDPSV